MDGLSLSIIEALSTLALVAPSSGLSQPWCYELRRAVLDAGAAREGRCFLGNATVLLVAVRGELYSVGSDLTVVRSDGPACIGCSRFVES